MLLFRDPISRVHTQRLKGYKGQPFESLNQNRLIPCKDSKAVAGVARVWVSLGFGALSSGSYGQTSQEAEWDFRNLMSKGKFLERK